MSHRVSTSYSVRVADAVDAVQDLGSEAVDLFLTDLAYESLEKHRERGTTTRLKESKSSSNHWFEVFRNGRVGTLLEVVYRALRPQRHAYLWCDDESGQLLWELAQRAGFYPWKFLTWVKTTEDTAGQRKKNASLGDKTPWEIGASQVRTGTGYHYPASTEKILFLEKRDRPYVPPRFPAPRPLPPGKGRRLLGGPADLPSGQAGDVFFYPRIKGWPTEKPVPVQRVLVQQSTAPGEVVCDPFCGSGSAGEAAVSLGRRALLSDLSKEAADLTWGRLGRLAEGASP